MTNPRHDYQISWSRKPQSPVRNPDVVFVARPGEIDVYGKFDARRITMPLRK